MNIKWDKGKCYNEAKKYKIKKEFRENSHGAYSAAWRNGWLKDYDWLITDYKIDLTEKKHMVYAYEFKSLNSVYIGLSRNIKKRVNAHKTDSKSSVNEFCVKNGIDIIQPIILEKNLNIIESQEKEDEWLKKYIDDGWVIINKAKTGKNIGSLGYIGLFWDKNRTFNEALKYKSRSELRKKSSGAYKSALINGWLNDYYWMKPKNNQTHKPNYWNYNTCYNEALKYKNKKEFGKKSETAFKVASKNKWLCDYTWFINKKKSRNYWCYETCKNEYVKYKNRREFCLKAYSAYKLSVQNGWIDEFFPKKDK